MDRIVRAMTADGLLRISVAITSSLVADNLRRHGGSPAAARAMARALTSVALMARPDREMHRLMLRWVGSGPLRALHVDLRPPGTVRGYCSASQAAAADVESGLGAQGSVSVVEQQESGRFTQGSAPLADGGVDTDLEAWLGASEQVPSVLRVCTAPAMGRPTAVVGVLIQTLPGGDETLLERGVLIADAVFDRSLPTDADVDTLLALALPDQTLVRLDETPLRLGCECSMERVERGVRLLGPDDLLDMIASGEPGRVRCEFCATDYEVPTERLCALLDELTGAEG